MQNCCIACNERFFYREGDEDCTEFICSFCMSMNHEKNLSKWARIRFRILNRDEFTCRYCGDSPIKNTSCVLHVDHIQAKSQLGSNSEKNLITACAICNLGKLHFSLKKESKEKIEAYLNNEKTTGRFKNGTNKKS